MNLRLFRGLRQSFCRQRKFWILVAAVFVLVLAATGSGWAAPAGDEAAEHRVWLPVIHSFDLKTLCMGLKFDLESIQPEDGAVFYIGDEVLFEFRFDNPWGCEPPQVIMGIHASLCPVISNQFLRTEDGRLVGMTTVLEMNCLDMEPGKSYEWQPLVYWGPYGGEVSWGERRIFSITED